MEPEELSAHFDFMLVKYDLDVNKWLKQPARNTTDLDGDDLRVAVIVDDETYCSAMHELGHIICQTKDEVLAWKWARNNAIYWSDEMDDVMFKCLTMYKMEVT